MNLDAYVTDDEVALFLRQDPSWPAIFTLFRALTRGTPSAEGVTAQECAGEAIRALEVLAAPDPERLQNMDLPCALALMYTSAGLKEEPSNPELRRALYLLRPIATLSGGAEHPDWPAGRLALVLAAYLHLSPGWNFGTRDLMTRLSRLFVRTGTLPDRSQADRAKAVVAAARCYPTTREQLKKEWQYLEQQYRERKGFFDDDRRAGHLYNAIKERGLPNLDESKAGRCYVATYVYGPESTEVALLCKFRDDVMLDRWPLPLIVALYYRVSPVAIRLFSDARWFKQASARGLAPLVRAVARYYKAPASPQRQ